MGAIVCELCGSNDVVKQDGFFVCQHCGTKYSLEEAKKMLGTVQIDNSNFVEKYLQNARRAKEKEDWEETEKYYNMVEANDPDNIEAIFYSAYGKAKASLTSDDIYKRQAIFNSLQKCISIVDDHYDPEKEAELKPVLEDISRDIINLSNSRFVNTYSSDEGGITPERRGNSDMTFSLFVSLNDEFTSTVLNIINKFPKGTNGLDYLYEMAVKHYECIYNSGIKNYDLKRNAANRIQELHTLWHQYNPLHPIPSVQDKIEQVNATEKSEKKQASAMGWLFIGIVAFFIIAAFTGG